MIDMPPRRTLPQQVRDKMLVDLRSRLDERPRRSKTPYAVAAGVAALVAGGVVAVTTVQGGPDPTGGEVTGDTKGVEVAAQRCMAASKKVGGFPAKADWNVVTHTALFGYTALAIKVADKPVFCRTSATSVTLTKYAVEPAYVSGSRTGVLIQDDSMLVGLVVDPSWPGIDAFEDGTLDSRSTEFAGWKYADGMALWWPEYPAKLTVAAHGKKPAVPLPKAPGSATTTVVDAPYSGPPPDRTSPGGKLLAHCIAHDRKEGWPLTEPDTLQPGPVLTGDTDAVVAVRGPRGVTICRRQGNPAVAFGGGPLVPLAKGNQPVLSSSTFWLVRDRHNWDTTFGSAPQAAASITMTTTEHKTTTAPVRNGTFVVSIRQAPAVYSPNEGTDPVVASVTVKDKNGKVLYQGKPALADR